MTLTATTLALATLAHFVGDYIIQNDWMATEKTRRWWPAVLHGLTYTLPFLFVTQSPAALLIIASTHVVIDRYRLPRFLIWAKNQIAPKPHRHPLTPTGFAPGKPDWLAFSLLIVVDNTVHMGINLAAIIYL